MGESENDGLLTRGDGETYLGRLLIQYHRAARIDLDGLRGGQRRSCSSHGVGYGSVPPGVGLVEVVSGRWIPISIGVLVRTSKWVDRYQYRANVRVDLLPPLLQVYDR